MLHHVVWRFPLSSCFFAPVVAASEAVGEGLGDEVRVGLAGPWRPWRWMEEVPTVPTPESWGIAAYCG